MHAVRASLPAIPGVWRAFEMHVPRCSTPVSTQDERKSWCFPAHFSLGLLGKVASDQLHWPVDITACNPGPGGWGSCCCSVTRSSNSV